MATDNWITRVSTPDPGGYSNFERSRIENTIYFCAKRVGGFKKYLHDEISIHRLLFKNLSDREIASLLTDDVIMCLNSNPQNTVYFTPPTVEDIQNAIESVFVSRGFIELKRFYRIYRSGKELLKKGEITESQFLPVGMPADLYQQYYQRNVELGCETVAKLNELVKKNRIKPLIKDSYETYNARLKSVAESFLRKKNPRVLLITGPSSSGKTTTKNKLCELLISRGVRLKSMELDNYYWDSQIQPGDAFGDHDFETPQALRMVEINRDIKALLAGESIRPPFYNFKKGRREGYQNKMKLEPDEVLLLDSLYGLFPPITRDIVPEERFQIYVEAMSPVKLENDTIPYTLIRMMRRMLRDKEQRNYTPQQTIEHWYYVRSAETFYIIPRMMVADEIINSGFAWEIAVLKQVFLEKGVYHKLPHPNYYLERDRMDPFLRTQYLHKVLNAIEATKLDLNDFSLIPDDFVIREFIGGSKYGK